MLKKTFTLEDQVRYAELSGDFNLIHVDPVYSRRSVFGVVVHGMNLVQTSIEYLLSEVNHINIGRVTVLFFKPVSIDKEIAITWKKEAEDSWRINILQSTAIVTSVVVYESSATKKIDIESVNFTFTRVPDKKSFQDIENDEGNVVINGHHEQIKKHYPNLSKAIGTYKVAALNSLTNIVGMKCPGLNSLFLGFDVYFTDEKTESMFYKVGKTRGPRAPFKISVIGGGLKGELTAIYRPSPVSQMGIAEVEKVVNSQEFSHIKALVIGGSRGLGELTSKILAAGGADVTITFSQGNEEAQKIKSEIIDHGLKCKIEQLDVLNLTDSKLNWIRDQNFNQMYYFATPRISANTTEIFDNDLFDLFSNFYVSSFEKISNFLSPASQIFYPSTTFLLERPKAFAEYILAKENGEALIKKLNSQVGRKEIVISRLPPLATDQTNTVLGVPSKPTLQVILDEIKTKMFSKGAN
jgi:acyl dehydratase